MAEETNMVEYVSEGLDFLSGIENIELYSIPLLVIATIWLIINTLKYHKGQKRSIKNLHRFAKAGEVDAQKNLAKRYYDGKIVKRSHQQAAFWYQKAAHAGDKKARASLDAILKRRIKIRSKHG